MTDGVTIQAAGGLLWRRSGAGIEIAIVHRPKYDDWSYPQGKLHPGEVPLLAACREVVEETGVRPVVGRPLPTQEYRLGPDRKVVRYWEMTPADGPAAPAPGPLGAGAADPPLDTIPAPRLSDVLDDVLAGAGAGAEAVPSGSGPAADRAGIAAGGADPGRPAAGVATSVGRASEVDVVRWLRPEEAATWLSYDRDRELLRAFLALPPTDALVLLLRHAEAGERSAWSGDDRLRRLDAVGVAQAQSLRALAWFGPHRVFSADRVRCMQTVAPLAADLGVPVETEPALAEDAYLAKPDRAVRRIREIARSRLRAVVCSQGEVIPDLVSRLAAEDGLALGRVSARKGSVWALSWMDGRLVAAHYYPDLCQA